MQLAAISSEFKVEEKQTKMFSNGGEKETLWSYLPSEQRTRWSVVNVCHCHLIPVFT